MKKEIQIDVSDEINFNAVWGELVVRKFFIISTTICAGIIIGLITLLVPNVYKTESLLAPIDDASGKSTSAFSLGGLASFAGVNFGSSNSIDESLSILVSRVFLWKFIEDNNLMPILFSSQWDGRKGNWKEVDKNKQPSLWDAYRLFTEKDGILQVDKEKKSNLVTVSVKWTDPVVATKWCNEIVNLLNEYLRQQAIIRAQKNLEYLTDALNKTQVEEVRQSLFEIMIQEQKKVMIAITHKEYAFKVLDPASIPDEKIKPKRGLYIALGMFGWLLLQLLIVFFAKHRFE